MCMCVLGVCVCLYTYVYVSSYACVYVRVPLCIGLSLFMCVCACVLYTHLVDDMLQGLRAVKLLPRGMPGLLPLVPAQLGLERLLCD